MTHSKLPMMWLVLLCALSPAGCGGLGGASLILKTPVIDECEKTGLKGCEPMTEGLLLVVEGDKEGGLKKVAKGAAQNAPDDVKKFAAALKLLGSIPGAAEYMGPILEVVALLEETAAEGGAGAPSSPAPADAAPKASAVARAGKRSSAVRVKLPKYLRVRTADSDTARKRVAMVFPSNDERTGPCGTLSESNRASCTRVLAGPIVVTDLIPSAAECAMSAASRDSLDDEQKPRWIVKLGAAVNGAQLFVPAGESLFLTMAVADEACSVVWSGYVPYGTPMPEETSRN